MSKDGDSTDDVLRAALGLAISVAALALGPALACVYGIWKRPAHFRMIGSVRIVGVGSVLLAAFVPIWLLWLDRAPCFRPEILQLQVVPGIPLIAVLRVAMLGWWAGSGVVLLVAPVILSFRRPDDVVRTEDYSVKVRRFKAIGSVFNDARHAPIGIDVRTGNVLSLSEEKRCSHVIVLGATGSGKTTLLTDLVLHAAKHGQPCLVIDPKGEDSTLEAIREMGRRLAPDFDARLRVFRMSSPENSASYNPLKHGNSIQLKDRIMEALNWSEQYYQSVAGDFLTVFTACVEKMATRLTLDTVARVLGDDDALSKIMRPLKDQSDAGDMKARELTKRMSALLGKVKAADLHGLAAQLSIVNNPHIGKLLSFEDAPNEIDLRYVLAQNEIAYFQLDTLGNPDTARRLGRLIIEDLKGLASHIYRSVPERNRKFFPIFIDEFGSFASKEFIEVLKQIRGARFGTHLFAQGLEDLDVVSPEFRRQASSNPITKIAFRLDDSQTVDEVCSMAGTLDVFEQSYQVEGNIAPTRTGMGNLRETKQMRVEHDVIKSLETGQAVVIEKSPSRVTPIQVFHPAILEQISFK